MRGLMTQRPRAPEPRRHGRSRVRAERHDDLERVGGLQPLHRRQSTQRRADLVLAGRRRFPGLHGRSRPRDRRRRRTCRASTSATTRIPTSASIAAAFTDYSVITARGELAKILSTHSVKTGVDIRQHRRENIAGGSTSGVDDAPQRLRPPARQHQQRGTARPRMGGVHARRDRHHDGQQHEPYASPTRTTRRTCRTTGACPAASR